MTPPARGVDNPRAEIPDQDLAPIERLLSVMAALRDPERGCPWDLEQDFESLTKHTIEEAYEAVEALRNGDPEEIKDELGDLLLQVVFYAQLAKERGWFTFEDIAAHTAEKYITRHPHVFGNETVESVTDVNQTWDRVKDTEDKSRKQQGLLEDVPLALPALLRSQKLQKRAARAGFAWPDTQSALAKIDEEYAELREALKAQDALNIEEEIGDMLMALTNLARMQDVTAENALENANRKFLLRFRLMELDLQRSGKDIFSLSPEEWLELWGRARNLAHAV